MIRTPDVDRYLTTLRPAADRLLAEMEAYAAEHDIPVADPETAALVAMLSRTRGAMRVLEVGLAIGYTALQVARAIPSEGRVISLEADHAMAEAARGYLARDPAGAKVEIVEGDARETILALENGFDLVYVDADKVGYPAYVEAALTLLQPRGLVVIDNLLMDGAVASGRGDSHWSQASVDAGRGLSDRLAHDPALDFVLLPVGDGVGLVSQRT